MFSTSISKEKSKGITSGFGTFCTSDKKLYEFLISTPQNLIGRDIICRPYFTGKEKDEYIASFHNRRIFVKGLKKIWTDSEIYNIFSEKWAIERAYAIRDHNGTSQTYGYVNFVNYHDVKKALQDKHLTVGNEKIRCFPYYKSKDFKGGNTNKFNKQNLNSRQSPRIQAQLRV